MQQIANNAIRSTGGNKIVLRLKELLRVGWSKSGMEVLKKGHLVLFLDLVQGYSVEHWLDETTVGGETNDSENQAL